jgi:quercetin dioxygenase-like cupin family protein
MKKRISITALVLAGFLAGLMAPSLYSAEKKGQVRPNVLMMQELKELGKRGMLIELNVDPGAGSPAHKHPGHVFGYVVDGEFEVQVDQGETKVHKPGEVFYEPDGAVHTVGRNPSDTNPAKVVVFMIVDPDQPVTSLVHEH